MMAGPRPKSALATRQQEQEQAKNDTSALGLNSGPWMAIASSGSPESLDYHQLIRANTSAHVASKHCFYTASTYAFSVDHERKLHQIVVPDGVRHREPLYLGLC